MRNALMPEYVFKRFNDVTLDFLLSKGIKALILDVDNTLEPYENPTPGPHVVKWINELSEAGIRLAIVSNNNSNRISLFNEQLSLLAYPKAGKPFSCTVRRALRNLGVLPENAAMIGDQIFTDVWAANNAGVASILVKAIKDKRNLLTKIKRVLEKPILKRYFKKHPEDMEKL